RNGFFFKLCRIWLVGSFLAHNDTLIVDGNCLLLKCPVQLDQNNLGDSNIVIQPASYRSIADTAEPLRTQSQPLETEGVTNVSQDAITAEIPKMKVAAAVVPKAVKTTKNKTPKRASRNRKFMAAKSLYFLGYQSKVD
ncbi:MAG: hypothetical protein V3U65_14530, partial [Granulosicoccaceae bacterium]